MPRRPVPSEPRPTARRRKQRVKRAFEGLTNERAVALIRRVLKGRDRAERASRFTFDAARAIANATGFADKAWYNAPRWAA